MAERVTNAAIIWLPGAQTRAGAAWWGSVFWRRPAFQIGPLTFFDLFTHAPGSGLLGLN